MEGWAGRRQPSFVASPRVAAPASPPAAGCAAMAEHAGAPAGASSHAPSEHPAEAESPAVALDSVDVRFADEAAAEVPWWMVDRNESRVASESGGSAAGGSARHGRQVSRLADEYDEDGTEPVFANQAVRIAHRLHGLPMTLRQVLAARGGLAPRTRLSAPSHASRAARPRARACARPRRWTAT